MMQNLENAKCWKTQCDMQKFLKMQLNDEIIEQKERGAPGI